MPIADLTADIDAQMRLAKSIGQGFGSFIRNQRLRKEAENQRELKKIQQQETLRILSGEGIPEEKLRALNEMPDAVNNKFVQRMNEKTLEEQLFAGTTPNQDTDELQKLLGIYEKTQTVDMITGQPTTLPGMEVIAQETQSRIKELSAKLFAPDTTEPIVEPVKEERSLIGKILKGNKLKPEDLAAKAAAETRRNIRLPKTDIPQPKTQAEYDAIPVGTEFIDTDGARVIKK